MRPGPRWCPTSPRKRIRCPPRGECIAAFAPCWPPPVVAVRSGHDALPRARAGSARRRLLVGGPRDRPEGGVPAGRLAPWHRAYAGGRPRQRALLVPKGASRLSGARGRPGRDRGGARRDAERGRRPCPRMKLTSRLSAWAFYHFQNGMIYGIGWFLRPRFIIGAFLVLAMLYAAGILLMRLVGSFQGAG